MRAITKEYQRLSGTTVTLRSLTAPEVNAIVTEKSGGFDVAICMAMKRDGKTSLDALPGAKRIAWKHPSGEPVWAAVVGRHAEAGDFILFAGGPTGHRLWSESKAGFTITTGKTHAEAFDWVVENRTADAEAEHQ